MKKWFLLVFIGLLLFTTAAQAKSIGEGFNASTQVVIRFEKLDWQTFELFAESNVPEDSMIFYEWAIDGERMFETSRIRYFFEPGEHRVSLTATDGLGNKRHDSIQLNIEFWSLYNNSFWWYIYGFVILVILYYWVVKLIYLFNRRRVSKEVQNFMDILDTHGLIEHLVAAHLHKEELEKQRNKSKT